MLNLEVHFKCTTDMKFKQAKVLLQIFTTMHRRKKCQMQQGIRKKNKTEMLFNVWTAVNLPIIPKTSSYSQLVAKKTKPQHSDRPWFIGHLHLANEQMWPPSGRQLVNFCKVAQVNGQFSGSSCCFQSSLIRMSSFYNVYTSLTL